MSAATHITGDISIHTQNIFPIIKKWLYSEHEIFMRELVSNAHDAITKRRQIAVHEQWPLPPEGHIDIQLNEAEKTITLSDNGLGMDAEDIQQYINQIAFSGAEDFVKKYQNNQENPDIIGHFGLGFYSAFMVADVVEIISKSHKEGATAVKWRCDGSTSFEITDAHRAEVGTDIVLHVLNPENEGFLKPEKLKELVQKYANFLPVRITVGGETANDQNPLWMKSPQEVTDEQYKAFYQTLFPFSQEPLFWIHLNVDYPFNLKGILYFPKLAHELDSAKGKIKLFCQQVFVTDTAKDIVPDFLTVLQGAIDCPNIPLNVSRSYLQNDPEVQKIAKHIVKKVADKLAELFKSDRAAFESYWKDIHPFIKFGMMQNDDFYQKTKDLVVFNSTAEAMTTVAEYQARNQEQLDKKVLYSTDKDAQASYIQLCKDQGLEVVFLEAVIDSHFIQFLEGKQDGLKFVSVDTQLADHLMDTKADDEATKAKTAEIETLFKSVLGDMQLRVEPLKNQTVSAMMLQDETMKRFKEMSVLMQRNTGSDFMLQTLVINQNSPVVQKILGLHQTNPDDAQIKVLCQQVLDLAKLAQKPLTGAEMQAFIERSNALLV
ncbi:MAG: molecular chaperone HtpG [Candidatus Margulisiibacteriota bacterium]